VPPAKEQKQYTVTENIDRQLAASGLQKIKAGKAPSVSEKAAIKRIEKAKEEQLRWQYYRTIPKKHWMEMSGRQVKVINEQGDRYSLHLSGKEVDLPKFVRAFHDFLANNATKLTTELDPLLAASGDSVGLERYRLARAAQEEIKLEAMRLNFMSREEIEAGLTVFAQHIRRAGDAIERIHGHDAAKLLLEALDDAERDWNAALTKDETGPPNIPSPPADEDEVGPLPPPDDEGVRRK
jgi:hypothetical protein